MTTYNDFKPETRSLIHRLEEAGFAIVSGNNGDENFFLEGLAINKFIDELIACDEAWLRISRDGFSFSLYLVLGNSPGELVSDYRYPVKAEGTKTLADLDAVTDAHYDKWEGRKQPTVTR